MGLYGLKGRGPGTIGTNQGAQGMSRVSPSLSMVAY